MEHLRLIQATVVGSVAAFISPTKDFFAALVLLFAFNIFCGMRADGITLVRCRNFSLKKFRHSLVELFLYLLIVQILYSALHRLGDAREAFVLVKTISYVFSYVYLQNSFKNLINAYPTNRSFRIIYHFIRFEFAKMMPGYTNEVIEKVSKEMEEKKQ